MPTKLFRWAIVAPAFTTIVSVCFVAFLKSQTYAACASDDSQQDLSSNQGQTVTTAALALAATAVLSNAAYLVFKSLVKQGFALAAAICAKWQPVYFLLVSTAKIVLFLLVITEDVRTGSCGVTPNQRGQLFATELLMTVALLLFSLSAICCDYDSDCTPAMRRGTYSACVVCLISEMMCSFVLGFSNHPGFLFGPFRLHLTIQLTSCIISQAIIMLHLLYVSCRSRGGRGWAYASLRFELVKQHDTALSSNKLLFSPMTSRIRSNDVLDGVHVGDIKAQVRSNVFHRLRYRLLQFRWQRLHASRSFDIPCVESDCNLSTGLVSSGLQLTRPLFRINCVFPNGMLRLADLHEKIYVCVVFIIAIASFVASELQPEETATLVFDLIAVYCTLGFFSCKRHNFDSVAAKHVAMSFKFVCILLLFLVYVALRVRLACLGNRSPQTACATLVFALGFLLCLLGDCSPNLSMISQSAISVCMRACII